MRRMNPVFNKEWNFIQVNEPEQDEAVLYLKDGFYMITINHSDPDTGFPLYIYPDCTLLIIDNALWDKMYANSAVDVESKDSSYIEWYVTGTFNIQFVLYVKDGFAYLAELNEI